jgi:hypothetical protein
MPPKKKKAEKKPVDVEEDAGPNIFKEIREKEVSDILINLSQPIAKLNTENIEFEILVQKIQDDITRVSKDNLRLEKKSEVTREVLVRGQANKVGHQKVNTDDREAQTKYKDSLMKDHLQAEQTL